MCSVWLKAEETFALEHLKKRDPWGCVCGPKLRSEQVIEERLPPNSWSCWESRIKLNVGEALEVDEDRGASDRMMLSLSEVGNEEED